MKTYKRVLLGLGLIGLFGGSVAGASLINARPHQEEASAFSGGDNVYLLVSGNWGVSGATFKFNFSDGTNYSAVAATANSYGLYTAVVPSSHAWTQWQILRMSSDGNTQWNYTPLANITGDAIKLYGDPGDASTNFWQTSVLKGGDAFYVQPGVWNIDSAVFGAKFYNEDESAAVYSPVMTEVVGDSTPIFEGIVPAGQWIYAKALRCASGTTTISSSSTIWCTTGEIGIGSSNCFAPSSNDSPCSAPTSTYSNLTRLGFWGAQFLGFTAACDSTGETQAISKSLWDGDIRDSYEVMGADVRKDLIAISSSGGTGDLYLAVARYDYMVTKYGTGIYANFANRAISGSSAIRPFASSSANSSILIISLGIVTLLCSGGYLFLKKSKETKRIS